jgi:hypothetical protein
MERWWKKLTLGFGMIALTSPFPSQGAPKTFRLLATQTKERVGKRACKTE